MKRASSKPRAKSLDDSASPKKRAASKEKQVRRSSDGTRKATSVSSDAATVREDGPPASFLPQLVKPLAISTAKDGYESDVQSTSATTQGASRTPSVSFPSVFGSDRSLNDLRHSPRRISSTSEGNTSTEGNIDGPLLLPEIYSESNSPKFAACPRPPPATARGASEPASHAPQRVSTPENRAVSSERAQETRRPSQKRRSLLPAEEAALKREAERAKRKERLERERLRLQRVHQEIEDSKQVKNTSALVVQRFAEAAVSYSVSQQKAFDVAVISPLTRIQSALRQLASVSVAASLGVKAGEKAARRQEKRRKNAAVALLQRAGRAFIARDDLYNASQDALDDAAAATLRRFMKGYRSRVRTARRLIESKKQQTLTRAASTIQRSFRVSAAKTELRRRRSQHEADIRARRRRLASHRKEVEAAVEARRAAGRDETAAEATDASSKGAKKVTRKNSTAQARVPLPPFAAMLQKHVNEIKSWHAKGSPHRTHADDDADSVSDEGGLSLAAMYVSLIQSIRGFSVQSGKKDSEGAPSNELRRGSKSSGQFTRKYSGTTGPATLSRRGSNAKPASSKSLDAEGEVLRKLFDCVVDDAIHPSLAGTGADLTASVNRPGGSAIPSQVINALMQSSALQDVNWSRVLAKRNGVSHLQIAAVDNNLVLLRALLGLKDLKLSDDDSLELASILLTADDGLALDNAELILAHPVSMRLFELAPQMAQVWQDFLVTHTGRFMMPFTLCKDKSTDPARLRTLGNVLRDPNVHASLTAVSDVDGHTIVSRACTENDIPLLEMLHLRVPEAFEEALTFINPQEKSTCLIHAVLANDVEVTNFLLRFAAVRAMVDYVSPEGTALEMGLAAGTDTAVLDLLLGSVRSKNLTPGAKPLIDPFSHLSSPEALQSPEDGTIDSKSTGSAEVLSDLDV